MTGITPFKFNHKTREYIQYFVSSAIKISVTQESLHVHKRRVVCLPTQLFKIRVPESER